MEIKKNYNRGDIYWVDANPERPAIGHVQRPNRPAVIVSCDKINQNLGTCEIVYLTTKPKADVPTHCKITSSGTLSVALCEQVSTVSEKQLGSKIGTVTPAEMRRIEHCIAISLHLTEFASDSVDDKVADLERKLVKAEAQKELLIQMYNNLLKEGLA